MLTAKDQGIQEKSSLGFGDWPFFQMSFSAMIEFYHLQPSSIFDAVAVIHCLVKAKSVRITDTCLLVVR